MLPPICKFKENGSRNNSELLYFILIYLLLFYDSRPLAILAGRNFNNSLNPYFCNDECCKCSCGCGYSSYNIAGNKVRDSKMLYFVLIFLILFY